MATYLGQGQNPGACRFTYEGTRLDAASTPDKVSFSYLVLYIVVYNHISLFCRWIWKMVIPLKSSWNKLVGSLLRQPFSFLPVTPSE